MLVPGNAGVKIGEAFAKRPSDDVANLPFLDSVGMTDQAVKPRAMGLKKAPKRIPKNEFKIKDEDLLEQVKADIKIAEGFFDEFIKDDLIEWHQLINREEEYYDAKFPGLSQRCKLTTSDIADTIEWVMPSLLRIFWGGSEIVSIKGRTEEDNPDPMKALIHFQVQSQNKGFLNFEQWFRDSLESGLGVLKVWWDRRFEDAEEEGYIDEDTLLSIPAEIISDIREDSPGVYWCKVKQRKMAVNQPRLVNIPPSEFIYRPDPDENGSIWFACHRHYMTEDELLRGEKAGMYVGVKKAMEKGGESSDSYDSVMAELQPYTANEDLFGIPEKPGTGRGKHFVYEISGMYDCDGDGIREPVSLVLLNGIFIRQKRRICSQIPFFGISGLRRSYSFWGKSYAEIIRDLQDLKTALIRQIVINISLNNSRKSVIDASQDRAIQDINDDRDAIRLDLKNRSINDLIQFLPHSNLDPSTFPFLEFVEGSKENRTGVTRYNQGADAESLNKTARGISMIMSASNQRIEMIARICAETGVVDLFRYLSELNQRFITQEQVVRLTNSYLTIRPDDLTGNYDFEVSAGVGVGTKETAVQNMQYFLSALLPSLAPMGIVTPVNFFNAAKKLVEEMGYKNTSEFLNDPAMMMQMQQAQMAGMVPPGAPAAPGNSQPAPQQTSTDQGESPNLKG